MSSSEDALTQLKSWESGRAKLFMYWAISGVTGWCVCFVSHCAESVVELQIEGIDGKDFLFDINTHSLYGTRFRFLDARESLPFFAPQRERGQFGTVLEISLDEDPRTGEANGRVVLAEFFAKTIQAL